MAAPFIHALNGPSQHHPTSAAHTAQSITIYTFLAKGTVPLPEKSRQRI